MPRLVPYDPHWPDQFRTVHRELLDLSRGTWAVEHIGSTSVPGLMAKPIIDVAVKLTDEGLVPFVDDLADAGWLDVGSSITTHPVRAKLDEHGSRSHIAHFFSVEQWESCQQRLFAQWLRDHDDDRDQYEQVKKDAVAAGLQGRSYTAAKRSAIETILDRACDTRGMPRIRAWDT